MASNSGTRAPLGSETSFPDQSRMGPFGPFLTPFGHLGKGSKWSGLPKVGVKWGGESKLVGLEGPSGVWTLFWGQFLNLRLFAAPLTTAPGSQRHSPAREQARLRHRSQTLP